ncbi:PilZ domain-containing protein [Sphingomonas sp. OK281]|uniref:PilZ domain-containing protein n=1 Tax=Sphingomonas sp. OK281 TaxID=1881067 RepID=UPI0008EAF2E3|nr:PilZ domain-containing protein [Sphingomonas sp. OK281]SFO03675.1 PilZ domain-containing protein [Sphingomonas sp. OK281]
MKELSVPCRMNVTGRWSDAHIHDVSDKGMLVSSIEPPAIGTYVDIRRGTLVIIGRVVWSGGRRFGVRTQDPVSLAALLSEPVLDSRPASTDRRSLKREQAARRHSEQADRNRHRASLFQFICLTIIGLGIACFSASYCYRALAVPLGSVSNVLGAAT